MTGDRHLEALDDSVRLRRTEKARTELLAAQRGLGRRERGVLFLCDGSRSLATVRPLAGEDVAGMISALIEAGYLEAMPERARSVPVPAVSPASAAAVHPDEDQRATASGLKPAWARPPTLAESRIFLFELLEITLVRSAPAAADELRERLREARDGQAMQHFVHEFVQQIEVTAGADRARTIRQRICERMPDVNA